MRLMDRSEGCPAVRFGDADIYCTLHVLSDGRRIGRRALAGCVGVTEGSMRTMLRTMVQRDLVDVRRSGIAISDPGITLYSSIGMVLVDAPRCDRVGGKVQHGIVVFGAAATVTDGFLQRDAAIIAGAVDAASIVDRGTMLIAPPQEDLDACDSAFAESVRSSAALDRGDVLVIAGASTFNGARRAAIAAGLCML